MSSASSGAASSNTAPNRSDGNDSSRLHGLQQGNLGHANNLEETPGYSFGVNSLQSFRQRQDETVDGHLVTQTSVTGSNEAAAKKVYKSEINHPLEVLEDYRPSESPNLYVSADPLSTQRSSSKPLNPLEELKEECGVIRRLQVALDSDPSDSARFPTSGDFHHSLSITILENTNEPIDHCILLLHDFASTKDSLISLAKSLKKTFAESAFILLEGPSAVPGRSNGYHWADSEREGDENFTVATRLILESVIKDSLVKKCSFRPQNIIILGHGQGGTAALAAAASWSETEFGGVLAIGGSVPAYIRPQPSLKAKTPCLVVERHVGGMSASAKRDIEDTFLYPDIQTSSYEILSGSQEALTPLLRFFAHRFRQEEWTKQAVISFDGGGIRGYGSLLILKELMEKIGHIEKTLDASVESSFFPCSYRPTSSMTPKAKEGSARSLLSESDAIIATSSRDLPDSSLFLPCHYFTYAAGTSTGGLISIMLSRLRMSVDECLQEYESLGGKVFGHPRPIPARGLLWPRYDHRRLEAAIRTVTSKYNGGRSEFESQFAMDRMDEDMFQCIVLAFANSQSGDTPYLFRTFPTAPARLDRTKSSARQKPKGNYGEAQNTAIWKVARATSAAPGYFAEMKIRKDSGVESVTFKDGGFGNNNPSEAAYWDIIHKHGGLSKNMGPFVSIGTGYKPLEKFANGGGVFKNVKSSLTNLSAALHMVGRTENAHNNMIRISNTNNEEQFPYYRFDGGPTLGKLGLGEWKTHHFTRITKESGKAGSKTLEEIADAIRVYLDQPDVQKDLSECAKILVERRRLRSRNASAWDRYACFSYYECEFKGCQKKRFNTIQNFKGHVRSAHPHPVQNQVLDKTLAQYRKVYWIYAQKTDAATDKGKEKL